MRGEWRYIQKAISPELCEEYVRHVLKDYPPKAAGITEDNKVDESKRISKVSWPSESAFPEIYTTIRNLVFRENSAVWTFDLDGFVSWQFTRYEGDKMGRYDAHFDTFMNDGQPSCRKLSVTVNLSAPQDYVGGHFLFSAATAIPAGEVRHQGTVVVFPSFLEHSITPVTKGVRHSLVGWFTGPNFR